MYEAWEHMTVLYAEVVVRTKHVGGNHSCVAMTVLLEITPANEDIVQKYLHPLYFYGHSENTRSLLYLF